MIQTPNSCVNLTRNSVAAAGFMSFSPAPSTPLRAGYTGSYATYTDAMPASDHLRAQLAFRIRMNAPPAWAEFSGLWMAFNAIYGGEPDARERSRVMGSIRRNLTDAAAVRVLRSSSKSVDKILALPPGNMLIDRYDPNFRAASARCAALYHNKKESARGRLAGVAGVLYQVRCNLIHGAKDPDVQRDRMLVEESLAVLMALVPELEAALAANSS